MSNNKNVPKIRVRTGLKSAGPVLQHGLRVRTGVKAGDGPLPGTKLNHGLRVRTGLKSAGPVLQHGVRIRQASR